MDGLECRLRKGHRPCSGDGACYGGGGLSLGADKVIVVAELSHGCPLATQMSGASAFGIQYLLTFTSETLDPSPFSRDIETQIPFPSVATLVVPPRTGQKLVANFIARFSF